MHVYHLTCVHWSYGHFAAKKTARELFFILVSWCMSWILYIEENNMNIWTIGYEVRWRTYSVPPLFFLHRCGRRRRSSIGRETLFTCAQREFKFVYTCIVYIAVTNCERSYSWTLRNLSTFDWLPILWIPICHVAKKNELILFGKWN
jgi:hypothetical protein